MIAPIVLSFTIKSAIWGNISYYLLTAFKTIPFFIPTFLNTIQLGATIDYGVLVLSRYEEERKEGLSPLEASQETTKWSSNSVLTSAGTMILMTLPSSILSDIPLVSLTMGSLLRGAIISALVTLILLPSILKTLDKLFVLLSLGWKKEVKL